MFAPILRSLDWNLVFHVHIDASAYAIGCILAQLGGLSSLLHKLETQHCRKESYNYIEERIGYGIYNEEYPALPSG